MSMEMRQSVRRLPCPVIRSLCSALWCWRSPGCSLEFHCLCSLVCRCGVLWACCWEGWSDCTQPPPPTEGLHRCSLKVERCLTANREPPSDADAVHCSNQSTLHSIPTLAARHSHFCARASQLLAAPSLRSRALTPLLLEPFNQKTHQCASQILFSNDVCQHIQWSRHDCSLCSSCFSSFRCCLLVHSSPPPADFRSAVRVPGSAACTSAVSWSACGGAAVRRRNGECRAAERADEKVCSHRWTHLSTREHSGRSSHLPGRTSPQSH